MGFLDKLKSVKNYITGGGAELSINMKETFLRQAFGLSLEILIKDVDIKADRIYLVIQNVEAVEGEVDMRNSMNDSTHGTIGNRRRTVRKKHVIVENKITLDESVLLEANESYLYEKEIMLPMEGVPTYVGKYSEIYWSVQAFVEKSGNDPNSKLVLFDPIYVVN